MVDPVLAAPPTLPELKSYLKGTGEIPDSELQKALDAGLTNQAARCDTSQYTASLHMACLRRAARELAATGAPLSTLDLGPLGSVTVARWDALIEEDEADYRLGGFA